MSALISCEKKKVTLLTPGVGEVTDNGCGLYESTYMKRYVGKIIKTGGQLVVARGWESDCYRMEFLCGVMKMFWNWEAVRTVDRLKQSWRHYALCLDFKESREGESFTDICK